jgi:hypothetical protein
MKWLAVAFVLALSSPALFSSHIPDLLAQQGQQENIRKQPACTIFCGDGTFNTIELGAKPCWGGPLPADGTGDHFKSLPEPEQTAICRNFAAANKSKESCPAFKALAQLCRGKAPQPPGKEKDDCEKPTPWFGGSSNCKEVQSLVIDVRRVRANQESPFVSLVTLSFCGDPVFRHTVPEDYMGGVDAYKTRLEYHVKKRVGSKICCDKWREAVRTGTPCNPAEDIDCDGKSNREDFHTRRLSQQFFRTLTTCSAVPRVRQLILSRRASIPTMPISCRLRTNATANGS